MTSRRGLVLHVLGSGCFTPGRGGREVRNPPAYAIQFNGQGVLLDLGFGSLCQMIRAGLSPDDVGHVFLTHRHPDHVGDLPALLFYYRYDGKPRDRRLRLYGPRGTAGFLSRLQRAHHPWLRPRGFALSVTELEEPSVVRGPGWSMSCREVPHTTESLAYRFDCRAGSVCYTGDTGPDRGLAVFARKAGLLVIEASLARASRSAGHLSLDEAVETARLSGARKVLLSHLSDDSSRAARRLRLGPRFRLAKDLMRVRI